MLSREELEELRQRAFASKPAINPPKIVELTEADKERIRKQLELDAAEVRKWQKAGRKYALKRNEVQSYTREQLGWPLQHKETEPLQTGIEYPYEKVNAPNVIRFIKEHNKRRGYELKQEFKFYLRWAKKLINLYGEKAVKEALIIAAKNAKDNINNTNNYITLKYVEGILARQLKENVK